MYRKQNGEKERYRDANRDVLRIRVVCFGKERNMHWGAIRLIILKRNLNTKNSNIYRREDHTFCLDPT